MPELIYNILQIGYGPVSQALALMLGNQGRSVGVVERWSRRYPLPRAVCIDHELYRVLAANGMRDVLPTISHSAPVYRWFNAEWRELLAIDWAAEAISGGPEVNFVHQPTLEEALDRAVGGNQTVDLHLGREAVRIEQHADHVAVHVRAVDNGAEAVLSGRYLVGCDGANSIVRTAIGSAQEDRGFNADWLVIDVRLKEGVTIEALGIPAAGQYCNPARPTTIVPAGVRDGRIYRRWEFMRLPGEPIEDMERIETVWAWLKPWAGPDDVELIRHKVYNFRSLSATRWRNGRLLIAGDAAHVMPPFMGQGMCAGLRDAWNLAWKLGLILDGHADDRLLDTYQPERLPHVKRIIDASIYLGKIICIPEPDKAAERDRLFLSGTAPPPPPFPHLMDGLIRRDAADPVAGLLAPHATIRKDGTTGRFDDLVGLGFVVVTRTADGLAQFDPALLGKIRTHLVSLDGIDVTGKLTAFMTAHGQEAIMIRPDFYIYGGARRIADIPDLVGDFRRDLFAAGNSTG